MQLISKVAGEQMLVTQVIDDNLEGGITNLRQDQSAQCDFNFSPTSGQFAEQDDFLIYAIG